MSVWNGEVFALYIPSRTFFLENIYDVIGRFFLQYRYMLSKSDFCDGVVLMFDWFGTNQDECSIIINDERGKLEGRVRWKVPVSTSPKNPTLVQVEYNGKAA